MEKNSGLGTRN